MSLPHPRITAMRFAAPRSPEGLAEAIDRAVSRLSAASAELLRWVPRYDEQKLWRHDGAHLDVVMAGGPVRPGVGNRTRVGAGGPRPGAAPPDRPGLRRRTPVMGPARAAHEV